MAEMTVLLLALANLLLGIALVAPFLPPLQPERSQSRFALLFAAFLLGTAAGGWLALLLAEMGIFSLGNWALLWLLATATAAIAAGRKLGRWAPALELTAWDRRNWTLALLLPWFVAALWLFFRPHETILGGGDVGVYVNTAAHVAQSGGLVETEPTLAAMEPTLYPALLRELRPHEASDYYLFPGFNVADAGAGRVIPDFLHLHPVWQALAYSGGGVHAALLLPGLWALLGCLAVALAAGQAGGATAAGLALLGMTLNGVQVWFARYPVTEMLSQYLLWTGLWALSLWLSQRPPRRLWALVAGVALGQLFLVRIDMFFLAALPLGLALWFWLRKEWQRDWLWFFVPMLALGLHGALHMLGLSEGYAARLGFYVGNVLGRLWYAPLLALLAGVIVLALLRRAPRSARAWLLGAAALGVVALTAYGWFVRPVVGAVPSYQEWYDGQRIVLTDRENLLRLGWYLSPLGVWLGALGSAHLVWRLNRRTAAIVAVGLFFSLLYLWRVQANPHHIYAMRRYTPVVLPFFIFGAATLLGALFGRSWETIVALFRSGPARQASQPSGGLTSLTHESSPPNVTGAARQDTGSRGLLLARVGLALLLAFTWLGGLLWSARGFISQVDNEGLVAQVAEAAAQLEDGAILIFNDPAPVGVGDRLGTPLHYLHGIDVFTLRDPGRLDEAAWQRQLARWREANRPVYWVGEPGLLAEQGLAYTMDALTIRFTFLEGAFDHKPVAHLTTEWVLPLAKLE